jgi:hypothetical protein
MIDVLVLLRGATREKSLVFLLEELEIRLDGTAY